MTSIEWFIKELKREDVDFIAPYSLTKKAKEMHKAEIIDAFCNGDNSDCTNEQNSKEFAEQYYKETF